MPRHAALSLRHSAPHSNASFELPFRAAAQLGSRKFGNAYRGSHPNSTPLYCLGEFTSKLWISVAWCWWPNFLNMWKWIWSDNSLQSYKRQTAIGSNPTTEWFYTIAQRPLMLLQNTLENSLHSDLFAWHKIQSNNSGLFLQTQPTKRGGDQTPRTLVWLRVASSLFGSLCSIKGFGRHVLSSYTTYWLGRNAYVGIIAG